MGKLLEEIWLHKKDIGTALTLMVGAFTFFWKGYKKVLLPIKNWINKHDNFIIESTKFRTDTTQTLNELLPNGGESMKDGINQIHENVRLIMIKQIAQIQLNDMAMFESDKEGHYIHINKKWSNLTGLDFSAAKGWGWLGAIHPQHRDRVRKQWLEDIEANSEFNCEFPLLNGTLVDADALIHRDKKGTAISIIGTIKELKS